ncbi:MAG: hypothetical protein ACR2PG_09965 [Hyphomicrobiaceae bacterium]
MPGDFFIKINGQPKNCDQDEWHHWHDQLIESGDELLREVDVLLASKTDEAIIQRLEAHRDHILSILAFARRILTDRDGGQIRAITSAKTMH